MPQHASLGNPKLDEPSMALALNYELFRKLKKLDEDVIITLLVEQNANLIKQVAIRLITFLFHRVY